MHSSCRLKGGLSAHSSANFLIRAGALAVQRVPSDAEKLNADASNLLYGSSPSGPARGHVKAMRKLMQKLDFDVR